MPTFTGASHAPSPTDLLSSISWFNRCLRMSKRAEDQLCELLDCSRYQLDYAICDAKSMMPSAEFQRLYAAFCKAEQELSEADKILSKAKEIQNARLLTDKDLQSIEC